jgi:hypothetical protein
MPREGTWFVMLRGGKDGPLPMKDENDEIALFETEVEADREGEQNPVGHARGFQVYRWPYKRVTR